MDKKVFKMGPIRPPFHANSLLLRVTENCTWNQCNFCTLYRGGKFKTRTVEEVKKDIDSVAYYVEKIMKHNKGHFEFDIDKVMTEYHSILDTEEKDCYAMVFNWINSDHMENVFLQDANTMVLSANKIAEIVSHIKKQLPSVKLIAAYGRADTLSKMSQDDFYMLKEAGLNMLHSGFESGCEEVLTLLNKGCTAQQQIETGIKVKKAGIEFNVFYMPGAGGKKLSSKNACDTAEVINQINPDFVRIRTFVVKPGTPMWQMQQDGEFDECSDIEKVLELREMLGRIKNCDGYVISDHIINLLPYVEGYMNKDMATILRYIDDFLNLPKKIQRQFQLARRIHYFGNYNRLDLMPKAELKKIILAEEEIQKEEEWEEVLRRYLRHYI